MSMSFIDDLAYKAGFIKEEQALYKNFSPNAKNKIEQRVDNLNNLEFLADLNLAYREIGGLRRDYDDAMRELDGLKAEISGTPRSANSGYSPAGSVLRKMYPNPLAMYTFLLETHWAAAKARSHNRNEFERDSYVIMADSKIGKREIKKVDRALRDLDIPRLRADMFDHLQSFSNFWVVKGTNALGGTQDLNLLLPSRLQPIYDRDDLTGWEYTWNNKRYRLPLDEVDHVKTYALSSNDIGCPLLKSVVIDMEADMHASIYTNTLWQKGGLIKAIIALDPLNESSINVNTDLSWAQKLQEIFARQYAGVRGAGQLMFMPGVKGVHNVINPKDLEGPMKETSEKTAIKVAELLDCPPEVLGIAMTSQYQNKAAILDFATLSTDNANYYRGHLVDTYITEEIIREVIGVEGVFIQQSGDYSATSSLAAETLVNIANSGCDFSTVNECRRKLFHWEPLTGSQGDMYIGEYVNKAMMLKAQQKPASPKETLEFVESVLGPASSGTILTRHYPREVRYY